MKIQLFYGIKMALRLLSKIFSIEIEGERYIMLSPLQDEISLDSIDKEYDDEILVFKLKDSDHGELLVHLKEEECKALTEKCKILVGKFINSYTD